MARLSANIYNAAAGVTQPAEGEDVLMLGWRLFWDARGPLPLYPHNPHQDDDPKPPVSWSGIVHDPNNPAHLVHSLESSAAGCTWLLDRWAELRSMVVQEQPWQSPDKLKAIRLLGTQPIEAFDVTEVGIVFLACHQLDPNGGELFHEIWNELNSSEIQIAKKRLRDRPLDWLKPHGEVEARQGVLRIVDRAVGRLQTIAAAHQKRSDANATLMPDRLAFDDSVEGERLRRYEMSCSRALIRTLDAIVKMRRATGVTDTVSPADSNGDARTVPTDEFEPEFEINLPVAASSSNQPTLPSFPIAPIEISEPADPLDPATRPSSESPSIDKNLILRNEPSSVSEIQDLPDEPTNPTPFQNPPNEPTAPTTSPHHEGGRNENECASHRGQRGQEPIARPHHQEATARRERSQTTERELTRLLPPRNLLNWQPPS